MENSRGARIRRVRHILGRITVLVAAVGLVTAGVALSATGNSRRSRRTVPRGSGQSADRHGQRSTPPRGPRPAPQLRSQSARVSPVTNRAVVYTTTTTATTTPTPATVPATASPVVLEGPPVVSGASSAGLSGSVNPQGLVTTAHFEYGLDAQYSAGGTQVYDQTTPSQAVGSDFAAHAVSANVTGLVPNAVYDARLVATNSAGTVTGPNQTFTTDKAPTPSAPTLGQTTNLQLISGLVLVKPPGGSSGSARFPSATVDKGTGFVPLTQARQVPIGSQIDARRGVLELVDNSGQQRQNQSVHLAGGLFTVTQTKSGVQKGLTTLALNESAFPGAPSYKSCPSTGKLAHASAAGAAHAAGLSSKVLQTLRASDHNGKFRTKGRYSSGTVRGTDWGTQDLCDGTLTIVHRGTVDVNDFGLRKTIAVHAGHTYLAKPAAQDKNKKKKKK